MPILMLCYMLQFLDKTSLSYASIVGISKDTVSISHVIILIRLTFYRVSMALNFRGLALYFILDT